MARNSTKEVCAVVECEARAIKREWCDIHYGRWRRTGDPLGWQPEGDISRFFSKVIFLTTCWGWRDKPNMRGYSVFCLGGNKIPAHIWAYRYFVGEIPEGKVLDHFYCSNRWCVNPLHVRPVSTRENLLRSDVNLAAINLAKTHCKHGHLLEGANLRLVGSPGRQERVCRACVNEWARQSRAAKRERKK